MLVFIYRKVSFFSNSVVLIFSRNRFKHQNAVTHIKMCKHHGCHNIYIKIVFQQSSNRFTRHFRVCVCVLSRAQRPVIKKGAEWNSPSHTETPTNFYKWLYLFRVLFGACGFPCSSLLFLSFVSFAMLRCFEWIRFVEGLSSSTRAKTWLRLTFCGEFSFSFFLSFPFCWFDPSVLQCCLSYEIYAGILICSARLLDFMGVTLLVMILISLSFGSLFMSFCVPFEFRIASQPYILIVKIRSLRNVHYMFEGVCSLGLGCSRRTFSVIVLSTCPLYPRDETLYRRWGFRDGVDLVVELWLVRATGNMDLRIQVPGLSYFSIEIVLGLLQHTLWSFWVSVHDEGYAPPFSPVAMPGVPQSGGGDCFLFRPSMIPFLNVVRRWSPFASASGSVALSWTVIPTFILLCYVFKWYYIFHYCMLLLYPRVRYIHCLDGMTLWLSFGS